MSAFLGPIHFWLYHKIELQESLIEALAKEAEKRGYGIAGCRYVKVEDRPLDELIDESNIHAWLQGRIEDVETRYARLVTAIVDGHPERMEVLLAAAYAFGQANPVSEGADASDAYKELDDRLVNGMPCDRVNVLGRRDSDLTSWEEAEDLHRGFWEEAGGNPDHYRKLRSKVIEGMLAASQLTYQVTGERSYEIRR